MWTSNFSNFLKFAIFQWAILETWLELPKKWGGKCSLRPEIYRKMYLVKFRKSSKMGRNLHSRKFRFWKSRLKIIKKNRSYRSRRADSKNIACLRSRSNIFQIFAVKLGFFEIFENCDILEKRYFQNLPKLIRRDIYLIGNFLRTTNSCLFLLC